VLVGHRNQLARTCKRHGAVTSRRKLNGKREWRRVMQLYGSSRCRTPTLLLSQTGKREMEEAVKEGETLFCQRKSRMQSIRPVAHALCVAHTPRLPVMLVQSTLV